MPYDDKRATAAILKAHNDELDAQSMRLALELHDTYEQKTPEHGYETRPETRLFDPASPNGRLMLATCRDLIERGVVTVMPRCFGAVG